MGTTKPADDPDSKVTEHTVQRCVNCNRAVHRTAYSVTPWGTPYCHRRRCKLTYALSICRRKRVITTDDVKHPDGMEGDGAR